MSVADAITRYLPRYESERKAPKKGIKLEKAFHRKMIMAAVAGS